ncbi:TonB-dependent receptor [Oleiagrimonas soli]|uniref:Outer membrane receptor protein involved in Fe transport n=2 Tax=Oleiagrimonas soli TaxID=1543381 RepID=A0A841KSL6_9GAMM|nr:TonB-dependent receptor [Oleiagrimonas soli]MBB6184948.1 outer membrane receptor protein involved in Fe transport [Oleiagrimonas soli]
MRHSHSGARASRMARRALTTAVGLALLAPAGAALADHAATPQATDNGPAPAASASGAPQAVNLHSITVTAQKREQQVSDVPIAMSAYSGAFLKDMNIQNAQDLSDYVPGFNAELQSPNTPGYQIRGLTSDDTAATQTSRVSIFQDGVDISRLQGSNVAMFDMQRIEVLRGPQSTLFGRGAESGAISLIENKPVDATRAGYDLSLGNYQAMQFSGFANTPLSDNVFGRLAVYSATHEGYYENLSGGRLNGQNTVAIRPSLLFKLGDDSSITLIGNVQRDTPPGTDFHSRTIPNRYGSTDVWGPADLNRGKQLGIDRRLGGLTMLGDFKLNDDWRLTSITGYRHVDSAEKLDADGSPYDLVEIDTHVRSHQFSQEFRFNYDAGGALTAFGGLSYFQDDALEHVTIQYDESQFFPYVIVDGLPRFFPSGYVPGALLGQPTDLPVPYVQQLLRQQLAAFPQINPVASLLYSTPVPFNTNMSEGYADSSNTRALDAFADGTWHVTDRFDLTAGVRVSRERIRSGYQVYNTTVPGTLGFLGLNNGFMPVTPNDLFAPTNGKVTGQGSFTSVVGRLVGAWQVGDHVNAYASVARGRKPNVIQVSADGSETLPPEILLSAEAGVKGDAADGRFLYDVAVYRYRYSDFQSTIYQDARYIVRNAGRANAHGLEMSLQGKLSDHASLLFNYNYIHARFADTDKNGNPQQWAGNRLRLTPDNSASLALLWDIPMDGGRAFYVRPSYSWKSAVYFEDDNNPNYYQKAYGLLNLRLGMTFDRGAWDVGLWARNLTGEKYLLDAGNTGATFGLPTYIPGAPRTFGISLSGRF